VLLELEPYFHIRRQVPLTHWTKVTLIVDAVMRPRDPAPWKDDDPIFAVEFKEKSKSTGTKFNTAWAAQCVDYANSMWDAPMSQRLRVFTCPGVTEVFEGQRELAMNNPAHYMSRLLWQLGVGELAKLEGEGWTLLAQGYHVLWSERRGVQEGARWSLTPKVGSR
jgi:hypothetical protein